MEFMYRIEDGNGVGPYHRYDIELPFHHNDMDHPGLYQDEVLSVFISNIDSFVEIKKYIFGFDTIKQYTKWFTRKDRRFLFENGFKFKKICVENKIVSDKQCIAKRFYLKNKEK